MVPRRFFEFFYVATPVFVAMDVLWGIPARAAGIPDVTWRWAYYGLLGVCWIVCRVWPGAGPLVGMAESTTNLLLLLLAVLLPIWNMDALGIGAGHVAPTGGRALLNLAISGPLLIISIKANERVLAKRWGLPDPRRRRRALF